MRTVTAIQVETEKRTSPLLEKLFEVKEDTLPTLAVKSIVAPTSERELLIGKIVEDSQSMPVTSSLLAMSAEDIFRLAEAWAERLREQIRQIKLVSVTVGLAGSLFIFSVVGAAGGITASQSQGQGNLSLGLASDGKSLSPPGITKVAQSFGGAKTAEIGTINPIESVADTSQGQEVAGKVANNSKPSTRGETGAKTGSDSESIAEIGSEESVGQEVQQAEEVQLAQQEAVATDTGATGGETIPAAAETFVEQPPQVNTPTETPTEIPPSNPTTPEKPSYVITENDGTYETGTQAGGNKDAVHGEQGSAPDGEGGMRGDAEEVVLK